MLIRKLFKAEMAHIVPGAYSTRCQHIHGHSYKFELFLRGDEPNDSQMVIDFKAIKDRGIYDFFDSFDHAVMLWEKDPRVKIIERMNPDRNIVVPFIPTAEMMAKAFFLVCQSIIETGSPLSGERNVSVERMVVHETDTGYAEFARPDLGRDNFPAAGLSRWRISKGICNGWREKAWYERAVRHDKKRAG